MSYILDALNKSDQDRHASETPSLNSQHYQPVQTTRPYRWIIILAVLALVNGLGIWYWSNTAQQLPNQTTEKAAPEVVVTKPLNETQAVTQPVETTRLAQSPITRSGEAVLLPGEIFIQPLPRPTQINPATPDKPAIRITELPIKVQRQIPDLRISSHLYATDSDLRLVNINGQMLQEGDMVSEQLKLLSITEDGVIIRFGETTFELSILRDWSFSP